MSVLTVAMVAIVYSLLLVPVVYRRGKQDGRFEGVRLTFANPKTWVDNNVDRFTPKEKTQTFLFEVAYDEEVRKRNE